MNYLEQVDLLGAPRTGAKLGARWQGTDIYAR